MENKRGKIFKRELPLEHKNGERRKVKPFLRKKKRHRMNEITEPAHHLQFLKRNTVRQKEGGISH